MMFELEQSRRRAGVLMGLLAGTAFVMTLAWAHPAAADKESAASTSSEKSEGISGDRMLTGTVTKIAGGQIEVDTGEMQPRVLPLKDAEDKKFAKLKVGDKLHIMLNEQNLVVDFHPAGGKSAHQRIVGHIAQPLAVGHERAIVRKEDGSEESYGIKSPARSKVASLQVGAKAVFLIDETHQIADVASDHDAAGLTGKKSPPKGAQLRIEGKIVELGENRIRIKTGDGKEHPYDVRPLAHNKLTDLAQGQDVILLLADDNTVIDVAVPSGRKNKGKG